MVESGSRPEEASGLRIDAVEVLPTDLRSVLLRVAGAWEGPRPPDLEAPALVLREGAREHRIAALPETSGAAARAAPEPQAFRAAFSVPDALAPLLEDETAELDLGPVTVCLPPPVPSGEEAEAGEAEGTVVDPAVLAERRARRAEQVEQRAIAEARTIIAEARHLVRELSDAAAAEAAARPSEAERKPGAERKPARTERRRPSAQPAALWLEDALRRLARMDAAAGAQLALQLLPGQALALERALGYDVVVAGLGWHRVTVGPGTGELAEAASRRPWWRTDFRVMAT